MPTAEQPVMFFATQEEFRAWLEAEHATSDGIWTKFAKKASGITSLNYDEALDVALCFGWIDGQTKRLDDTYYLQRWTPRRKRSPWSQRNVDKVGALIEAGLMQPAGQAEIDRAKADGRWERAYGGAKNATVPDDLQAALDANPKAAEFFATLRGSARYAILYRLQDARKPETRQRRLAKFVGMLERGEKLT
jgi:uncharacterized protein YdeI (YjbR/CyaY-like superfamily)